MRMVFRWFGTGNDTVTLPQIRQIPGVEGIVWSLHHLPAGEEWPQEEMENMRRLADEHGFHIDVVESVNIHDDIKLGLPSRDLYIERYIRTIRKLAAVGVKTICYNFMPIFDWVRTDLHKRMVDGSTAMFLDMQELADIQPEQLIQRINENPEFSMPGWEPERLAHLSHMFDAYRGMTADRLREHLRYFLEKVIPVAEECDVKMAIHPDDPPWSLFGLPRIVNSQENIRRILELVDSPYNGLTLCTGSLSANRGQDIISMIHAFADRIPFVHIRNIKVYDNGDFIETSHRTCDGSVDISGVVKALHDVGYTGYARPDHGRQIWDEHCRPGYGLYDRALGIMYLWGVWDALERTKRSDG